jgi:hypothetical protein
VDVKQNLHIIPLGEFGELTVGFLSERSHCFRARARALVCLESIPPPQ